MYYVSLVIKFLHICSVILMVGGIVARQLVRSRIKRSDDPRTMDLAFQITDPIERVMVVQSSLPVLVFGVVVALMTRTPIFGFLQGASRNWLLVANVLIILNLLEVPLIFLPKGKVFEKALEDAVREARVTPDLRASLDDPVTRWGHVFEIVAVTLVVLLMVLKPF